MNRFTSIFQDRLLIVITILYFIFSFGSYNALAEENTQDTSPEESKSGYYVELQFPENQNKDINTYYDLTMKPGEIQTVNFLIVNESDKTKTFDVKSGVGMTGHSGVINYVSKEDIELNSSMKYPFFDVAEVSSKITVEPKEKKLVPVTLKMPKDPYSGIILGAIIVSEADDVNLELDKGVFIGSKIQYEVIFKLGEEDKKVVPELNLKGASISQLEGRNVVFAELENIAPVIMNNVWVEAKVTKKGSKDILYKAKQSNMQIAPNSNFDFPIYLGTNPFAAGKYTVHVFASALGGYEWNFSSDFTISKDDAEKFNQLSIIELDQIDNNHLYLWIISIVVVIILIILFIIFKNNKKDQKQKMNKTAHLKKTHKK